MKSHHASERFIRQEHRLWIRALLRKSPLAYRSTRVVLRLLRRTRFHGSIRYWEDSYSKGGTSGPGSYGALGAFKARVVNKFLQNHGIRSVVEFGCGDGHQISQVNYQRYVGLDVSRSAIQMCRTRFKGDQNKSFFLYEPNCFVDNHGLFSAELAISLDVIYHLVEDDIFEMYMEHLFSSAQHFVIIYSIDSAMRSQVPYSKPRNFSRWIEMSKPEWVLTDRIPNEFPAKESDTEGSFCEFFIYRKGADGTADDAPTI